MISEDMPFTKKFAEVKGKQIAYIDEGKGDPIVLIHGNPTSSFLWRNVIPELTEYGRVIAPDLVGHGDSGKMPTNQGPKAYSLEGAYSYIDLLFQKIDADKNVILVLHDWGSAIGFMWAMRHMNSVKGLAYMEAIVTPLDWKDWPENAIGIFKGFRSEKGEDLIGNRNLFIEAVLPSSDTHSIRCRNECLSRPLFKASGPPPDAKLAKTNTLRRTASKCSQSGERIWKFYAE